MRHGQGAIDQKLIRVFVVYVYFFEKIEWILRVDL